MIRYLLLALGALALATSACGNQEVDSSPRQSDTSSRDRGEPYPGYAEDMQAEELADKAWREYQEECNDYIEQRDLYGDFEDEARECEANLDEHYRNELDRDRSYEDEFPEDNGYSGE